MKKATLQLIPILITPILLTGCMRTQESRLYMLDTPLVASENVAESDTMPVINIADIQIPNHLSRPVVVTKVAENELAFSDFHRWAGPLKSNIRQVLVENLSILLESNRIFADPRKQTFPADYHIEIGIYALTGILGETATLQARWAVFGEKGNEIITLESFHKTIPIRGESRRDYVSAQSDLLVDLSRAIAESIPKK